MTAKRNALTTEQLVALLRKSRLTVISWDKDGQPVKTYPYG